MPKPKKPTKVVPTGAAGEQQRSNAPPNKILFVTNLPQETEEELIRTIFERYVRIGKFI